MSKSALEAGFLLTLSIHRNQMGWKVEILSFQFRGFSYSCRAGSIVGVNWSIFINPLGTKQGLKAGCQYEGTRGFNRGASLVVEHTGDIVQAVG